VSPPVPYAPAGRFLRERFGGPIFRIVVDAGFSCPNRDATLGTQGCAFCNVDGFRPPTSRPQLSISEQIARPLPYLRRRHPGAVGYLVYFQPYTNTYGPASRLAAAVEEALAGEGARGVIVGTRPDCLADDVLDLLVDLNARTFLQVELGVQSTRDRVLREMGRGHRWRTSRVAIGRLRRRGIRVGAHMILGTPWESAASEARGARLLSQAGIDAVKIHQLQVLQNTPLARQEDLELPTWREYAERVAGFLAALDDRIIIERLVARTRPDLLIAPRWGVDPARVREEIVRRLRGRRDR